MIQSLKCVIEMKLYLIKNKLNTKQKELKNNILDVSN